MPKVTIISRERLLRFPTPGKSEMQVAVTFQSNLLPPRTVFLPQHLYSDTPADDPAAVAGITVIPKDQDAQAAEDDAMRRDIASLTAFAPPTREL